MNVDGLIAGLNDNVLGNDGLVLEGNGSVLNGSADLCDGGSDGMDRLMLSGIDLGSGNSDALIDNRDLGLSDGQMLGNGLSHRDSGLGHRDSGLGITYAKALGLSDAQVGLAVVQT